MAPSATTPLLTILSLLAIAATTTTIVSARPGHPFHPCNTLIVSTYSFSLLPNPHPHPTTTTPNHEFLIISAELHPFRHRRFLPISVTPFQDPPKVQPRPGHESASESESGSDLLRDMLSIFASILFGAACGALTAGTMFLIWSLFNPRGESYRAIDEFSNDDDGDEGGNDGDDDDVFEPKKEGYVAIPVSGPPAKVVDSIPTVAPGGGGNGAAPAAA